MSDFEYWKSEKQGTEFVQSKKYNINIMFPPYACWVIDNYLEPGKLAPDYQKFNVIPYLFDKIMKKTSDLNN